MTANKRREVLQEAVETLVVDTLEEKIVIDWKEQKIELALDEAMQNSQIAAFASSENLRRGLISGGLQHIAKEIHDVVIRHKRNGSRAGENQHRAGSRNPAEPSVFTGQETEQERQYREIVNLFIERELANRSDVLEFRRKLSGGEVLTEADAGNVLANELAGIVTFGDCEEQGLSPVFLSGKVLKHTSVTEAGEVEARHWGQFAGWSREQFRFEVSVFNREGKEVAMTITHSPDTWKCLAQRKHCGLTYVHSEQSRTLAAVIPPTEDDAKLFKTNRTVSGFHASIVGTALDIAADISQWVQWEAIDSLLWLLSGKIPERSSDYGIRWPLMTVRKNRVDYKDGLPNGISDTYYRSRGPVEMIVQPWAHPKGLEAFFRTVIFPGRQPLPQLSNLDLFRRIFTITAEGNEPSWAEFLRTPSFAEWSSAHKSQTQDRGAIRTTYKRVEVFLQKYLLWLRPALKDLYPSAGRVTISPSTGVYVLRCPKCGYEPIEPITKQSPCPRCTMSSE